MYLCTCVDLNSGSECHMLVVVVISLLLTEQCQVKVIVTHLYILTEQCQAKPNFPSSQVMDEDGSLAVYS